jgi:hypothetical protein
MQNAQCKRSHVGRRKILVTFAPPPALSILHCALCIVHLGALCI